MPTDAAQRLPPGQQLAAIDKWPTVGEKLPAPSDAPWTLTVAGLAARPGALTLEDLRQFPQRRLVTDIHCVTRWSKFDMAFVGVSLADVLDWAVPTAEAKFISFVARSERAHSTSLPLADALALGTLLAFEANGAPLSIEHGGPLRTVVPSRYFYKSLKWLTRLELLAADRLGHWEGAAGYHNSADPWREERFIASSLNKRAAAALFAQRDLCGQELLGLDASDRDLSGLRAAQAILRNARFQRALLRNAVFEGANLALATFEGADLRGASFRHAGLDGVDFTAADLRDCDLRGALLTAATFGQLNETGDLSRPAIIDSTTKIDADACRDLMPAQQQYLLARATLK